MAIASVSKELDVSPDALWKLAADFGNTSWMPGMSDAKIEGDGIGMVRVMGGAIREKLEAVDPAKRTLSYSIADEGIPFPVTGYYATMVIEAAGSGSKLTWSCDATPNEGTTEAEVKATIEGMYEMMFGWISDHLKSS
jgi:hypothetical protein